ncbi:putative major capsid protein [Eel River basin pequenovirus]|nr:putative major capsid protein [Eel River basin pequenovirus]
MMKLRRSKQSLTHQWFNTGEIGQLLPIGLIPVLPGDVVGGQTNLLTRVTPLAAPVFHRVDVEVRHVYASNRILWNDNDGTDWEEFITGGEDGMNADTVPTIANTATAGDLLDKFCLPRVASVNINALPVRMYNFIWNEMFRDQDLQTTKRLLTDVTVAKVNWAGDYLTNARPFSSKGPAVSIPVGTSAPIKTAAAVSGGNPSIYTTDDNTQRILSSGGANVGLGSVDASSQDMYADLNAATGADPIAFRRAWGIQRFMEHSAEYGSRYPEKMRALGSRYKGLMERPQVIGGGRSTMNFSEVLQTANDASDRAYGVGDMYGHGIDAQRTNKYAFRVDEHGYIMTLMFVRPKAMYQNGIPREWLRTDREDFHDPYLEDIGMQEVWLNEIYADSANTKANVFGYAPRYDEYRGQLSCIGGDFRSTLDHWHLARKFATAPTLNSAFKEMDGDDTEMKRIFNEQSNDSLWFAANNSVVVHRNISKRANTRLI